MDYDSDLHAAWRVKLLDIVKEYRIAEDGNDVRGAWKAIHRHIAEIPSSMDINVNEMLTGISLQRKEIESLRESLRENECRILELCSALQSLASVARRYLPNYDEHPAIQKADDALQSNT